MIKDKDGTIKPVSTKNVEANRKNANGIHIMLKNTEALKDMTIVTNKEK